MRIVPAADAKGQGDLEGLVAAGKGRDGNGLPDAFGDRHRLVRIHVPEQQEEFLAAPTGHQVLAAQVVLEDRCHGFEHLVAAGVAVGVVDGFEPVDITQDNGKALAAGLVRGGVQPAAQGGDLPVQELDHGPAIGQVGEGVGERHPLDLLVFLLQVGDGRGQAILGEEPFLLQADGRGKGGDDVLLHIRVGSLAGIDHAQRADHLALDQHRKAEVGFQPVLSDVAVQGLPLGALQVVEHHGLNIGRPVVGDGHVVADVAPRVVFPLEAGRFVVDGPGLEDAVFQAVVQGHVRAEHLAERPDDHVDVLEGVRSEQVEVVEQETPHFHQRLFGLLPLPGFLCRDESPVGPIFRHAVASTRAAVAE